MKDYVFRRIGGLEIVDGFRQIFVKVFRRIGGLENARIAGARWMAVFRRIGGLERLPQTTSTCAGVFRRIGGLEKLPTWGIPGQAVFRRIGGLERTLPRTCESGYIVSVGRNKTLIIIEETLSAEERHKRLDEVFRRIRVEKN